jgi:hypothetical protein
LAGSLGKLIAIDLEDPKKSQLVTSLTLPNVRLDQSLSSPSFVSRCTETDRWRVRNFPEFKAAEPEMVTGAPGFRSARCWSGILMPGARRNARR